MELSGQLHASAALLLPEERAPGAHSIGESVGPRVDLDAVEKRTILYCRKSKPCRPDRPYTD
jgi:hypothetical protein